MFSHTNTRLPTWLRVAFYATSHSGERLDQGQLRNALGCGPSALSRAIATAAAFNLIEPTSSARCLWVKTSQKDLVN